MDSNDLLRLYDKQVEKYGEDAPNHISDLLRDAKNIHKANFQKKYPNGDADQSWRAFKGNNLEKLIFHIIDKSISDIGLKVINGKKLSGVQENKKLDKVKRNTLIDYGQFGCHLPDVDLIIYKPRTSKVVAIISSKVTLRERVAQTGYWKFKLKECSNTKHINVLFVTLDEYGTLTTNHPSKKGRAIVEIDLDGTYVLATANLETSNKVKLFSSLINDIKKICK